MVYNIQRHDKTETVEVARAAMRTKHNHDLYTHIQPRRQGDTKSRRLSVNDHDLIGKIHAQ